MTFSIPRRPADLWLLFVIAVALLLGFLFLFCGGCVSKESLSIQRSIVDPETGEITGVVNVAYDLQGKEMEVDEVSYEKVADDGTRTTVKVIGLKQQDRAADVALAGFGTINKAVERIAVPGFTTCLLYTSDAADE